MDKDIRKEEREWEEKHNGGKISREDIKKSKKRLTLDDIDAFHRQLKRHINKNMTGVSAVYLHLYISFMFSSTTGKKTTKPL